MAMLVQITYKNHRGETKGYTILPQEIWCGTTPWHKKKQWLLKAHDEDAGFCKDFALQNILAWEALPESPPPAWEKQPIGG